MNAKKCDRCGKLYELYKGVKITEDGNSYNRVVFTGINYGNRDFDLCPDCMTELIDFIKAQLGIGQRPAEWCDDKCSVCGKGIEDLISSPEWYRNGEPNFCPFCGARVRRGDA